MADNKQFALSNIAGATSKQTGRVTGVALDFESEQVLDVFGPHDVECFIHSIQITYSYAPEITGQTVGVPVWIGTKDDPAKFGAINTKTSGNDWDTQEIAVDPEDPKLPVGECLIARIGNGIIGGGECSIHVVLIENL